MLQVSEEALKAIQKHFHALILERAVEIKKMVSALEFPELLATFDSEDSAGWFSVPGMYGGFKYWFESEGNKVRLITESWSRVVDGSGRRHEITREGSKLVGKGFI